MKKVVITILIIILLALLGLIGYQYSSSNEENININNGTYGSFQRINNFGGEPTRNDDPNYIYKIDGINDFTKIEELNYLTEEDKINPSLPFIYKIIPKYTNESFTKNRNGRSFDIAYKQFRNEFEIVEDEQLGIISVPYINIKMNGVEKINYMLKAMCLNANAGYDYYSPSSYEYYINIKDDLLSISVSYTNYYEVSKAFNIDLKNKKILNDKEILKRFNITEEEFKTAFARDCYTDIKCDEEFVDREYKDYIETLNNDELLYGYEIDLNKDLNDYCKYNFDANVTYDYANVRNKDNYFSDGKNNISLINDEIVINKLVYYESRNDYMYNKIVIKK